VWAGVCVIAEPKPLVDDLAGQVKDGGIVVQDEVGVGGQDDPVQLEGEPVRVVAGGKVALVESRGREAPDQRHELRLEGGHAFLDRAGAGAHLQGRASEEAAPGEGPALQVIKERLAHRHQLGQAGRSREGGLHDFFREDPARLLHGRQLEFLLRAEVLAMDGVATGVACDGCPALPDLLARYEKAGGRFMVCPVCFNAKQLDKGNLLPNAELAGSVQLWDWIGDGATTFSY
jgi:hypothetical protein